MEQTRGQAQAEDALWNRVSPELNEALATLRKQEQEAVLLRFFMGLTFAELARAVGLTEDAARMRVQRALSKMRRHLAKAGIALTSAVLETLLAGHAAHAVPDLPSGLLTLLHPAAGGQALDGMTTPGANALARGVIRKMQMTQWKSAAVMAVVVAFLGVILSVVIPRGGEPRGRFMAPPPAAARPEPSPSFLLKGHTGWVWSLAFSRDGRFLASGSERIVGNGSVADVRLWDAHNGAPQRTLSGPTGSGPATSVALSPDGNLVAASFLGGAGKSPVTEIQVWDTKTGELRRHFSESLPADRVGEVETGGGRQKTDSAAVLCVALPGKKERA